jgi:heme/copper-type cytochrome/quinol oxidase subunit 3
MAAESGASPLGAPPTARAAVEIPPEPPELSARALAVGSRLLAGGTTFFFLAFVFAYFYLRSINEENMWRPAHTHLDPNQALGAAMIACVVVSALATILAGNRMKVGGRNWAALLALAVVLGLAGIALQCIEYTVQHFGPTDGAYASVFCAWTGLYLIAALATMYWLETKLATELRARRSPGAHGDIAAPDLLIAPGLGAVVFFWSYLAGIGVLMYVVLYLL